MASSCRVTCLKIEGNNLLKEGVEAKFPLFFAYDPVFGWT